MEKINEIKDSVEIVFEHGGLIFDVTLDGIPSEEMVINKISTVEGPVSDSLVSFLNSKRNVFENIQDIAEEVYLKVKSH